MADEDAATRRIAGRYRLDSLIGRGGAGAVWRGHDEQLRRAVAVKEITFPGDEQSLTVGRQRALREARAAARLRDPGVVGVYDIIEEDGSAFLIMELVDAPNLNGLVRRDGPMTPRAAARLGLRMLDALAAAHRAGVVHRDVKPSNVLIDGDRPKLTDFGIARLGDDATLTSTGVVLGTPAYIAPEHARGDDVGPAADLYGLGATLFYAVEGTAPFGERGAWSTIMAVLNGSHRPMRRAGPLEPLLIDLLARDPAERPGIAEVRRRLRRVAAGSDAAPVGPPPAGSHVVDDTDEIAPREVDGTGEVARGEVDAAGVVTPGEVDDAAGAVAPGEVDDAAGAVAPGEVDAAAGALASGEVDAAGVVAPDGDDLAGGPVGDHVANVQHDEDVEHAGSSGGDAGAAAPRTATSAASGVATGSRAGTPAGTDRAAGHDDGQDRPPGDGPPAVPPAPPTDRADRGGPGDADRPAPSDAGQPRRTAVLASVLAAVLILGLAWAASGDDPPADEARGDPSPGAGAAALAATPSPAASTPAASPSSPAEPTSTPSAPESSPSPSPSQDGVLPAYQDAEVPEDWVEYRPDDAPYRVSHPPGWQVVDGSGNITDLRDPATGTYLRLDWVRDVRDPVGAWEQSSAAFARSKQDYRNLGIRPTTYKGDRAALWEYRYREGGAELHAYNLGVNSGQYGFALNLQARRSDWQEARELWPALLSSYRFEPG